VEEKVELYDRLSLGDQLMLFRWKPKEGENDTIMSAEEAVEEFQEGMILSRKAGGGGGSAEMEEERRKILEEREKWEEEKNQMSSQKSDQDYQRAMASVDNAILDLLPKAKEAKQTVDLLNRVTMTFDVVLEKGADHVPKVKVNIITAALMHDEMCVVPCVCSSCVFITLHYYVAQISVENSAPKLSILIEPTDFLPKLSLLKDEMMKLRSSIDAGRDYELPDRHDPLFLMFDNDFHLGKKNYGILYYYNYCYFVHTIYIVFFAYISLLILLFAYRYGDPLARVFAI
jgi:hypothetical protein